MRPLIRTLAVGLLALGLVLPMTAADAHRTRWRTTTSFGLTASGGEAAVGTIDSPKRRCVKRRTVRLYQVRRGKDRLVGVDRRSGVPSGNGAGYWVIRANLKVGKRYYVRVVRKDIGRRGHRHLCRAYRTKAYPYY